MIFSLNTRERLKNFVSIFLKKQLWFYNHIAKNMF